MPNFISEDDIEVAMVQRLQHVYGYDTLNCHTAEPGSMSWRYASTPNNEFTDSAF